MGDDMQGPEAGPARKGRGDLPRGRPVSLEKDRLDARPQGTENGRNVGDATVDEKQFADMFAAVLAAALRVAAPPLRAASARGASRDCRTVCRQVQTSTLAARVVLEVTFLTSELDYAFSQEIVIAYSAS